ncbi:helix-turn-helix transcriptional regulator [Streptomyces laculatispora]|uniref:Helix-turn-helix transcriptional regulator n=1 Tax=Streptomyces laculatispora TaxID=887464 RepID=A0ABY9ID86_9ACTN|nr:helix-turn-helix transcriptional regulator [Streptomyces laculatispora]WLQ44873.1 helix-turn-helix transcriptional regulator [Streptomyces laculatispora]
MTEINLWDRNSWDAIRRARGIGYQEIADATGITYKAVTKWFYAERNPSLHSQILMAKALGIPLTQALKNITDPDIRSAIRSVIL